MDVFVQLSKSRKGRWVHIYSDITAYCLYIHYLTSIITSAGAPLSPSTSLSLEAAGPCTVEWKVDGKGGPSLKNGGINIIGSIVADGILSEVYDNPFVLEDEDDDYVMYSEEEMSDAKEEEEDSEEVVKEEVVGGTSNNKKRKLDTSKQEKVSTTSETTKLSKKQRKELAQQKAKQLEEALSANREAETAETDEKKSSKKKKKKKAKSTDDSEEVPKAKLTSLTRERRLAGGIILRDILVGTGATVTPGRRILLHYTASLLSTGQVFDKNHSKTQPLQFRQGTGEVIRGLERGLEGMKVGGERVITVPAALGYGSKGIKGSIPPDSDLSFEVRLVGMK